MDKIEKKEIIKANLFFAIFSITILTILTILIVFCEKNNLKNKAEAYTNDVVPYAQVTDLTGTSWSFNSELNLSYQQTLSPMTSQFNVNFVSDNTSFNKMNFGYFLNSLSQPFGTYYNPSQVNVYSKDGWNKQEYRLIVFDSIDAGTDATNQNLINWLYNNATLQTPQLNTYTISANLNYCTSNVSFPLEVEEGQSVYLEFTPITNYIFNTYEWTISPTALDFGDFVEEPFKIAFEINNISSDITINIDAVIYVNLKGQWVLRDFSEIAITPTTILRNVAFRSNGYTYNNISALGSDYLRYYSDDLVVNVLSLVDDGFYAKPLAYLPTTTYNYNLITIDSDYYGIFNSSSNLPSYLKDISYFMLVFRPATQEDLNIINYENGKIEVLQNEYTFFNMFGALIDAPIQALRGLLNFTFFGINLFSFLTLFITLAIVYLCIKMLKGGRKDE